MKLSIHLVRLDHQRTKIFNDNNQYNESYDV